MKFLYSNMLPIGMPDEGSEFSAEAAQRIAVSDKVEIAVGYVSRASLLELDRLVREAGVSHVVLTIGMYYVEGMPESSYHTACEINDAWVRDGIGEIRLVKVCKFHGKLYCFYKSQPQP